ncbi:MAG: hypothetical protein AB7J32_13150 [Pseudonocardia sp.]
MCTVCEGAAAAVRPAAPARQSAAPTAATRRGYALVELDDPDAFAACQLHHSLTYGHAVTITFEPVFDLDRAMTPFVEAAR